MRNFLPLMIDLNDKKIVIFGGGDVGERKAAFFCENSKVTVISREFNAGLEKLHSAGKIKIIKVNNIDEKDITLFLKNAFIVIPALNDTALNEKVADIARNKGTLVNRVDEIGDIIIPSVIRRDEILLSISTGGQSPALSKYMRQKLEEVITPEFAQMSRLQNEIREKLKSTEHGQKKRKEILWRIINDSDVWKGFEESYEKAYVKASKYLNNTG